MRLLLITSSDQVKELREKVLRTLSYEILLLRQLFDREFPKREGVESRSFEIDGCVFQINPPQEEVMNYLLLRFDLIYYIVSFLGRALDLLSVELSGTKYVISMERGLIYVNLMNELHGEAPTILMPEVEPNPATALEKLLGEERKEEIREERAEVTVRTRALVPRELLSSTGTEVRVEGTQVSTETETRCEVSGASPVPDLRTRAEAVAQVFLKTLGRSQLTWERGHRTRRLHDVRSVPATPGRGVLGREYPRPRPASHLPSLFRIVTYILMRGGRVKLEELSTVLGSEVRSIIPELTRYGLLEVTDDGYVVVKLRGKTL